MTEEDFSIFWQSHSDDISNQTVRKVEIELEEKFKKMIEKWLIYIKFI